MSISILGLDPGMVRLGASSLTINDENKLVLGQVGLIEHPKDASLKFNEYLNSGIYQIAEQFPQLLHLVRPDFIVAEIVPVGRLGSNTELVVAAITVCKVIAWQWGVEWYEVGASTVKTTITGDKDATKAKVRRGVERIFPSLTNKHKELKKEQKVQGHKVTGLPPDVFDSVAIAVTGAVLYTGYGEQHSEPEIEDDGKNKSE